MSIKEWVETSTKKQLINRQCFYSLHVGQTYKRTKILKLIRKELIKRDNRNYE